MKPSFYTLLLPTFLLAACVPQKKPVTDTQAVQMAENQEQSGNTAGAVQILQQALADHPNDPVILKPLGFALIANQQPQDAMDVFDKLIAVRPNDASAYNGKAVALDRSFKHDAAQDVYRQALKLSPDSLSIQNNLAMSMILSGQVDQAITRLEKLERQSHRNQTIRQNLALAYGIKGDKKKALALNLKDMPAAEAKENMRFYEVYAKEYEDLVTHRQDAPDADHDNAPASLDDLLSSHLTPDPANPQGRQ